MDLQRGIPNLDTGRSERNLLVFGVRKKRPRTPEILHRAPVRTLDQKAGMEGIGFIVHQLVLQITFGKAFTKAAGSIQRMEHRLRGTRAVPSGLILRENERIEGVTAHISPERRCGCPGRQGQSRQKGQEQGQAFCRWYRGSICTWNLFFKDNKFLPKNSLVEGADRQMGEIGCHQEVDGRRT